MQIEKVSETLICEADDGSTTLIRARLTADKSIIGTLTPERIDYALSVSGVDKVSDLKIKNQRGEKVVIEWRDPNFVAVLKKGKK